MAGRGVPSQDLESGVPPATFASAPATGRPPSLAEKIRHSGHVRAGSTEPSTAESSVLQAGNREEIPEDRSPWDRLRNRIPSTIQRPANRVCAFLKRPEPARTWTIRPIFPRLQELPLRLVDKVCPRRWHRIVALGLFYICWIATFGAVLHESSAAEDVNGYGQPVRVACGSVFW